MSREERFIKSSTSKGNQVKWVTEGEFVKADTMGYESIAEALVSDWLGYIEGIDYVDYYFCKILEDGTEHLGCYSHNMLKENEFVFSVHRILEKLYGRYDIERYLKKYSGEGLVDFVVKSVAEVTGLDISDYLRTIAYIDALILNEDRHLNNIALICNDRGVFKPAPIFDNGLSLLSDVEDYPMLDKVSYLRRKVKAKPFSTDFSKQCGYFDKKPLVIDMTSFVKSLDYKDVPFKKEEFLRAKNILLGNCRLSEGKLWIQK